MSTRGDRHGGNPYDGVGPAALGAALLFGVGAFVVMGIFMGLDYFSTRDDPTELATVVSIEPSGTKERCGPKALSPNTPGERTTYRSDDPPQGLPAEFGVNHCPNEGYEVGDVVPVRRSGPAEDDITVEPIESAGQWLGMAAGVAVMAGIAAGGYTAVKEAWGAFRRERRKRRRAARAAGSEDGSARE
jgi:hypothetical protein